MFFEALAIASSVLSASASIAQGKEAKAQKEAEARQIEQERKQRIAPSGGTSVCGDVCMRMGEETGKKLGEAKCALLRRQRSGHHAGRAARRLGQLRQQHQVLGGGECKYDMGEARGALRLGQRSGHHAGREVRRLGQLGQ